MRFVPILCALALVSVVLFVPHPASAATAIRINPGGYAQTVDGVKWAGCSVVTSCTNYVTGGNAWSESPPTISGIVSPDSKTIESSEWTGGPASGVPAGQTAFTFTIPVPQGSYDVKLHFTEVNKTAVGQRVFDVQINGNTVLSNFDIFSEAGGEFKAITRTFDVSDANGKITIAFVGRVQNAKVNAIEVLSTNTGSTTSSSTSSSTTSSSTTSTSTTSTTATPPEGAIAWTKVAASPIKTLEAAGGALDGKLYFFGGYTSSFLPVSTAYAYTPSSNSWTRLADMPKALTHMGEVIDESGDSFIFAGGYGASNGNQVFATSGVYRYNVDTKQWTTLPSLPATRGSGALALVGSTLHFMGGVNISRQEQSTHWTLDLNNTSAGWQTATAFPHPQTHFAAETIGTDIYTFGGLVGIDAKSTEQNGVYKYDTVAKTWSQVATTPVPISHNTASTFVYNGRIWMVTGETKFAVGTTSVWSFDPSAHTWRVETPVAGVARHAAIAGQIAGTFYVTTGIITSNDTYKGVFQG